MLRALALALFLATPLAAADKPAKHFEILSAADFPETQTLPPPPAAGSEREVLELEWLHRLIAATSPARLEQARWDDQHEDPGLFDAVVGRKLEDLPATWALLKTVQNEGDRAADIPKLHFARRRPWSVDATMPNCDAGKGANPLRSYPSGHATLGYSVGWTLAQLMPDRAPAILARADDYALSRQICGVHFPSDTEASHVIGTIVAERLWADPRLAERIAAARAELVRP